MNYPAIPGISMNFSPSGMNNNFPRLNPPFTNHQTAVSTSCPWPFRGTLLRCGACPEAWSRPIKLFITRNLRINTSQKICMIFHVRTVGPWAPLCTKISETFCLHEYNIKLPRTMDQSFHSFDITN